MSASAPPEIVVDDRDWLARYHPGDVLAGKYRLEELLGEGGMGAVWRARNLALDSDVAVKLLHPEDGSSETAERLEREAHAAARLEHPHAVRVFDLGRTDLGDPFMVMEVLRGEPLRAVLDKRRTLSAKEAVQLLLPIAGALAAAHDKGIVHRDLKPENVVLAAQDGKIVPKVVDFGIAKVEAMRGGRSTTHGTVMGSPAYMSPEQASGRLDQVDARTDVWSLGVVLFETLTGAPPFAEDHPLALLRAVIERPIPPWPKGLDGDLTRIVDRALQKDPAARWPDMRTMGQKLARWAVDRGLEADASGGSIATTWLRSARSIDDLMTAQRSTDPPRGRRGPRVAIAAAVVCLVGVGLGLGSFHGLAHLGVLRPPPTTASPARPPPRTESPAAAAAPGEGAPPAAASAPVAAAPEAAAPEARAHGSASAAPPDAPPSAAAPGSSAQPASSSAAAAPGPGADDASIAACMVARWPEGSFDDGAPLARLCAEPDPRKGASLLGTAIAAHGQNAGGTTEAMRIWSLLSWYELAAAASMRFACCPADPPLTVALPPPVGICPPLGPVVEELGRASTEGPPPIEVLARFKEAIACEERGQRINGGPSSYRYGAPHGGAESAFVKLVSREP